MTRVHTEVSFRPAQQGFTLIELMIVVAIVALLAAVAIPSYRSHVIKTNRSSAESFMHQVANKEEQVLLDMRNYVSVTAPGNFPAAPMTGLNMSVPADVLANYNVTVAASAPGATTAAPGYVITAVPNNPPQNDPLCQTLTLDNTGAKSCNGTGCAGGSPAVCWQ